MPLIIKEIISGIWDSKNYFLYFSVLFLCILFFAALLADLIIPYEIERMDVAFRLKPPSVEHLLGTDNYGRDILSRVIMGSRVSLIIGISVSVLSSFAGTFLGMTSALIRRADNLIMRFLDGLMAFPTTILAIALVAVFGAGLWQEIIALSLVFSPRTARIMRGVCLELKESEYVQAAIISGGSTIYIALSHILRNGFGPLLVQATFVLARAIIIDAGLSFLGLGVPPPEPTWGNMLGDARGYIAHAWWFIAFPGVALLLTVMSINVLGDNLRDILDPRTQ